MLKLIARFEATEGSVIPTTHYIMWSKVRENTGSLRFDMIFNLHFVKKQIRDWLNPMTFSYEDTLCWKRFRITIRKVRACKHYRVFAFGVWAKYEGTKNGQ